MEGRGKTSERAMAGSRGEAAMGSRGPWLGGGLPREGSGGRVKNTDVSVVVARRFPDGLVHRFGGRWASIRSLVERGGGRAIVEGRW